MDARYYCYEFITEPLESYKWLVYLGSNGREIYCRYATMNPEDVDLAKFRFTGMAVEFVREEVALATCPYCRHK